MLVVSRLIPNKEEELSFRIVDDGPFSIWPSSKLSQEEAPPSYGGQEFRLWRQRTKNLPDYWRLAWDGSRGGSGIDGAGARVAIAARRRERLAQFAKQLRDALAAPTDAWNADWAAAMVEQTATHFGGLDVLMNKGVEPRSGSRLGIGRELLAKGQLDDCLLPASSEERQDTAEK